MEAKESRVARNVGVGCVTAVGGLFSGAMFAVLIAKIVGSLRKCPVMEHGAPCDWHIYAGVGAVIGLVTLPAIALSRLRASDRVNHPDRG